ncbi:MAG: YdiU family protein [Defluviitaleaceae bacterium]|nr:YdiU family protein [Defluviitaleaceae bacterium]
MSVDGWNFEHTYTNLPEIFYSNQEPANAPDPQMVVFNRELAQALGLRSDKLADTPQVFAGASLPYGAKPIAQAYAGYQFGHFAMLGDGRAVLLGEQIAPDGRRFDIQLKGSGRTTYSRNGDGLAALSPMLREYIISEAMFALGIPTTRSLAVVLTGKGVIREKVLQGAVLTRVASSHIRVGTFNYISAFGKNEDLRALSDYCILRHFPWIESRKDESQNKYVLLLREVARLQASLIAKWQLVGFVHGVMNTDNMAISGETIDYGPCAFMDAYDPETVFSSIDTAGRYAFGNQSGIGAWNLSRFAESLLPLLHEDEGKAVELAQEEIADYWKLYNESWLAGMRGKLGLSGEEPENIGLVTELLGLMWKHELDYTNTFRSIMYAHQGDSPLFEISEFAAWNEKWRARLGRQKLSQDHAVDIMKKHNPAVIPRNHRVEEALAAAEQGDYSVMNDLLTACREPYQESEHYSLPPEPASCKYKTFCGT